MRRTLLLLLSSAIFSTEALKLRAVQSDVFDACATVDCASGLVCGLAIPQSCNVSPCPKIPTCLPQNQTCSANSCKADETCVLRSVTCVMAPCYPVRECAKYPKCGDNEEYNECSLSGPCEPNCTDSFPICSNVTCGKGACECKTGYYRHNGKCILKTQCPDPTCEKPNEVWNKCPSACTQTCRIFRGKDAQMICPAVCDIPQCTCAVGYVRDDDWNCVKQDDCPKEFKCSSPHEEYKECSSHCEPTCDNQSPSCIESCGPAKCQCKPNYVRHEGSCLFALQCPLEGNSTLGPEDDMSGSEENSGETSGEEVSAPSCDTIRCGGNSACSIQGGKPVCSKCGKNEKVDPCPNACSESTCEDGLEKRMCMAVKMCRQQKCICDEGFVRNTKSGQCIKQKQCPKVDNSTVHIMPIFQNWTKPLIRPAFPDNNRTIDDGMMHILPFPVHDGAVHVMPISENGTALVDPIFRPQVRPFFPDNGTMHSMPHFGNATIQISPPYVGPLVRPAFPPRNGSNESFLVDPLPTNRTRPLIRPFFPDNNTFISNGTMHTLPFIPRDDGAVHIMPHFGNDTMLVDPIFNNRTRPMIRPAFPDRNGTMHILPFIPRDDGAVHTMPVFENGTRPMIKPFFPTDGTAHIMPHNDNGTMISLPYVPNFNGSATGSASILPFFPGNGTRPMIKPFFPAEGSAHIMPHIGNGTMISLPYVPNFNGSASASASLFPFFPGNGSFHTMPISENGTMNILPFFPNEGAVHVRPIFTNRTRPQVMPLFPGNGTMHTLPYPNEGAVHIMPVFENGTIFPHILPHPEPNSGAIHIMPFPANSSASTSGVCANHTCPEGSWCEETPVMCLVAPCPPIPTCVSVTPRGGKDQPSCGKNEEYSTCAPKCQDTCRGVSGCLEALMCTPGCVCKDKFKRDGNGVCVPNHKCWKSAGCQDNEIWHKCRPCEPTCTDSMEICTADCVSGCGCEDGFVRGPKGDCITQSKCPKSSTNSTKA